MLFQIEIEQRGLANREDQNLWKFIAEFDATATELASALVPIVYAEAFTKEDFIGADLKCALDHLHKSLTELDTLASRNTLPGPLVAATRKELLEIRDSILRLMIGFREQ